MRSIDRFVAKIQFDANDKGCWIWTGSGSQGEDYPTFKLKGGTRKAHRVSYVSFVRPIHDDCEVDHLCKNSKCVNPDHLEAVTPQVNNRRKNGWYMVEGIWHCKEGHPCDEDNLQTDVRGNVRCLACQRTNQNIRRNNRQGRL